VFRCRWSGCINRWDVLIIVELCKMLYAVLGFAGLLFSKRRPQCGHRAPALSQKANKQKLMFTLGHAFFESVDSIRMKTSKDLNKGLN
jgi:hypothetical protein